MTPQQHLWLVFLGLSLVATIPSYFQLAHAQPQQDAASTLNGMSPEILAKVRALAQILEQGLKEGKISDVDIQQGLTNAQLGEKLKQLIPEATQLMNDLSDASRQGKAPGEESLLRLYLENWAARRTENGHHDRPLFTQPTRGYAGCDEPACDTT